MSISAEYAEEHKSSPAVLCCRAEEGIVLTNHNLEDPEIFDDLVDQGLLKLDGCLTIGEVLGGKLLKTSDSLTPLTKDLVEVTAKAEEAAKEEEKKEAAVAVPAGKPQLGGSLKIHIGEGKGIDIQIPLGALSGVSGVPGVAPLAAGNLAAAVEQEEVVVRSLVRKHFKITEVKRGPETKLEGTVLTIREGIEAEAVASQELVEKLEIEIITPDKYHTFSNTIMDVQPIATKEGDDEIGCGTTRVLDGVVMVVSGTDSTGVQIGEFGSSEGYLDENIMWGRPGAPDKGDIFIKTNVIIKEKTNMERPGPLAAHTATDMITDEIRKALKKAEESLVVDIETFNQVRRPGKKKVVIVKEIMGQGAMHDNVICPTEPCGIPGGSMNVDCGNVPIMLTPNQVRDGSIHALTCIGPATKEMTRHYIREPLVEGLAADDELDLIGVIFVGSPQVNDEKLWVSERLGSMLEALDIDGCIITTEGFGNNHIDFIQHIGQAGERGIPVVGASFCAYQGQLVVGNKYATAMVEENMDKGGFENDIAGCSCVTKEVAARSIQMLKNQMMGVAVNAAPKKWNNDVINSNNKLLGLPETELVESGTLH